MGNIISAAKIYIERGYNVLPVHNVRKIPVMKEWTFLQKRVMTIDEVDLHFRNEHAIAMLTGGFSRILCVDVDLKYDLSGDLFERYIAEIPQDIRSQMLCQTTRNKGRHLVVRVPASKLVGNQKWAARPTTADEKHETYLENFKDFTKKDTALKTAISDSNRVLIETRSGTADLCGGYFLITPSEGYKHLWGKVGEIDEDQYEVLENISRSFNQVKNLEKTELKKSDLTHNWEITPFDDFNERVDIIEIFEEYGWDVLGVNKNNVRLRRPGKTYSASSGEYDIDTKVFNCYSTSTCFDVGKGYNPVAVFKTLACEGDEQTAYLELIKLGYGKKK
jgi:hypothetical protein